MEEKGGAEGEGGDSEEEGEGGDLGDREYWRGRDRRTRVAVQRRELGRQGIWRRKMRREKDTGGEEGDREYGRGG